MSHALQTPLLNHGTLDFHYWHTHSLAKTIVQNDHGTVARNSTPLQPEKHAQILSCSDTTKPTKQSVRNHFRTASTQTNTRPSSLHIVQCHWQQPNNLTSKQPHRHLLSCTQGLSPAAEQMSLVTRPSSITLPLNRLSTKCRSPLKATEEQLSRLSRGAVQTQAQRDMHAAGVSYLTSRYSTQLRCSSAAQYNCNCSCSSSLAQLHTDAYTLLDVQPFGGLCSKRL